MKPLYIVPLLAVAAVCAPAPTTYDQRQEGEVNVRADLQNIILVALVPKIDTGAASTALLSALSKSSAARKDNIARIGNVHPGTEEAFVESKTPYSVDINRDKFEIAKRNPDEPVAASRSSESVPLTRKSSSGSDNPLPDVIPVKNNKYVVAAGRIGKIIEIIRVDGKERGDRKNSTFDEKKQALNSGLELIGARENCGPDQYRDVKGICRLIPSN